MADKVKLPETLTGFAIGNACASDKYAVPGMGVVLMSELTNEQAERLFELSEDAFGLIVKVKPKEDKK